MHCDVPNGTTKGQTGSNLNVRERKLHRRFEVKGEDSRWSYLSWSGRGAKESSSLAATRPPKAKSTSMPRRVVYEGFGVSVAGDSCRSRVVVCDLRLSSSRLGFTSHAWVDTATTALTGTRTPMAESGIGIPISTVKPHKPYFTPQQVQDLCEKTRGKFSVSQEAKVRQHACTFIEAVGAKIGL